MRYQVRDSHTNQLLSTHDTLDEAFRALDAYQRTTHRTAYVPTPAWLAL